MQRFAITRVREGAEELISLRLYGAGSRIYQMLLRDEELREPFVRRRVVAWTDAVYLLEDGVGGQTIQDLLDWLDQHYPVRTGERRHWLSWRRASRAEDE